MSRKRIGGFLFVPRRVPELHDAEPGKHASELRKYRVVMILAHQYLSQLDLQIRDAISWHVGNNDCVPLDWRCGDSENEFRPELSTGGLDQPSKLPHLFEADDRW